MKKKHDEQASKNYSGGLPRVTTDAIIRKKLDFMHQRSKSDTFIKKEKITFSQNQRKSPYNRQNNSRQRSKWDKRSHTGFCYQTDNKRA